MKKLMLVVFVLMLVAAACGGGTSITVAPDEDATSGDAATSGDDVAVTDGDDGSDDGSGDDGGSSSAGAFCGFAGDREAAQNAFENVDFRDPDAVQSALDDILQLLNDAIRVAPAEVSSDLEIVRGDLDAIYDRFEEADFDVSQLGDADFEESAEVVAAGERIDDYVRNVCGIDPDTNGDDGGADGDDQTGDGSDALIMSVLESLGFTGDQAACLAGVLTIEDFEAMSTGQVQPEVLNAFSECGVSIEDLAEVGGADTDQINEDIDDAIDDVPPEAMDAFAQGLIAQGFTEEEAVCLAGEMLSSQAEVNADITAALESCGIPLSRMLEIGQG